jgi:hypothetical protein
MAKADPVDDELAFGLARVLDGIEVLVAKAKAGPAE